MPYYRQLFPRLMLTLVVTVAGCAWRGSGSGIQFDPDLAPYYGQALEVSYPDVASPHADEVATLPSPLTIHTQHPPEPWDLTLDDAIKTALANSKVMRDMGGIIIEYPETATTIYDPAIVETNPRFGVEGALSAFDASFAAHAFFENNDRALNNVFFGGGTRLLRQDLHDYQAELSKRSATGGEFTLRNIIGYDLNNAPGNNDPNLPWTAMVEGEFRQPLLQGAGVEFNRIAGPDGRPGYLNGVLLARINTDISLTDFELAVRDLVNDVEITYWELYYAYRDLDAKVAARDRALQTWRSIHALYVTNRRGGEAEKEAQAREQYFRLEEEVQNAWAGRAVDDIRTLAFRGVGGVQTCERRLRRLMGVPTNDGRLIRPVDDPALALVVFDWHEALTESLIRRAELRKQKWIIKQRELELLASRNFLLPRVDALGRYRFRGLGHDLSNSQRQPDRFNNAIQDLTTGDFQEWQLGVEVEMPVGFRQAHAAVRNAELLLLRARAILDEQEKIVAYELSQAIADVARAYTVSQTSYNRRWAAGEQLVALETVYQDADEGEKTRLLDLLLDAQRRLADAEASYFRDIIEYNLAIKNVHLLKGSLLEYNQVYLSEGPWPMQAYYDAGRLDASRRVPPRPLNYVLRGPGVVSAGPYPQRLEPAGRPVPPEAAAPEHAPRRAMEPLPDPGIPRVE